MAQPNPESTGDSADHVLAEYLRRVDQGEAVDRERFIAEHPEAAEPLREYFAGSDAIRGVVDDAAARVKPGDPAQATLSPDVANPVTHAQSLFTTEATGSPVQSGDEVGVTRSLSTAGEPVGVAQVAAFLASSGLMTPEAVDDLLNRASSEDDSTDAARLLDELQDSCRLTPFQCQAIREGRTAELVLGNYVVLDRLGRGGMGQVFRAWHRKMDRVVALKTLRPETMNSQNAVRRFHREVKTAARLAHPNIVTAYDANESAGMHFLVMEHVAGSDLAASVREHGPASVAQAADWVLQAARGLAHAHQHGIVHRDIKPGNLLLGSDGTVKILDMGLARLEERLAGEGEATEGLTRTGDVLGTLDYMAPEQILDTRHAGPAADMYSLGCTLHFLLMGKPPYDGRTVSVKLLGHRKHPIPSLRAARSEVPEGLDRLLQRMLGKRPEDRPASMGEVIASLEPFAAPSGAAMDSTQTYHGPLPVAQPSGIPLANRRIATVLAFLLRRRLAVAIGAFLFTALVLFAMMVVLRLPTPAGTLIVEVNQPGATVEVVESTGSVEFPANGPVNAQDGNRNLVTVSKPWEATSEVVLEILAQNIDYHDLRISATGIESVVNAFGWPTFVINRQTWQPEQQRLLPNEGPTHFLPTNVDFQRAEVNVTSFGQWGDVDYEYKPDEVLVRFRHKPAGATDIKIQVILPPKWAGADFDPVVQWEGLWEVKCHAYDPTVHGPIPTVAEVASLAPICKFEVAQLNWIWWNQDSVPLAGMPDDHFILTGERTLVSPGGTYRFESMQDDGIRVLVGERVVIDDWRVGAVRQTANEVALPEGKHTIRVEYFEHAILSRLGLWVRRMR